MVLVGFCLVVWGPVTADSGLLVGRGVVMVLRLGLWRLLVLNSWMTYFLSLVTPSGSGDSHVDGSLWMRYCSTNFSNKKPAWKCQLFGGVVAAVAVPPSVAGCRGSGDAPSFRDFEEGGRTTYQKDRHSEACWCRSLGAANSQTVEGGHVEGCDSLGCEEGTLRSAVGLSHVGEPKGIG